MLTIIAYHEVTDTEHWLSSPKREEVLGPLGASGIRTFVDRQNPTKVAVLMEVADLDSLRTAVANPPAELAEAMRHDGGYPGNAHRSRRVLSTCTGYGPSAGRSRTRPRPRRVDRP